jgi:imidazolonepropionase
MLREHGVPIAISTDCNPGSSPCTSLLLMLNMACTLFRLTPEEALAGVTRNAAQALGLRDRGVLAAGMRADFVLWDVQQPAQLAYAIGFNPHRQTVFGGRPT